MSPAYDLTLQLAIGSVVVLTGCTLAFMGYAFLLHLKSVRVERRREALERRWKGRLLDAATGSFGTPDRDAIAPEDFDVDDDDRILFLEMVTEYARALEGPERRNVEEVGRPHLHALDDLLEDDDAYRRAHALDMLGELGFDESRERLARGLEDPSGLVAMVAARALARRGNPEHVPVLLQRLDAFASWSANYLSSLLVSFGAGAAPHLRALAADTTAQPRFRGIALQALRELHDLDAADLAAQLLREEEDAEVVGEMVRLIGALGGPEHLPVIRPLAGSDTPHVRAAALRAIANLTDRRSSDVERVSEGLDDPSPWVALQAAHGLVTLGHMDELRGLAASDSPRAALAAEVLEGTQ